MKKLMCTCHRHQLVHNCSASEINDDDCSVDSKTKCFHNEAIHFPTGTILDPHMSLMKEMADLFLIGTQMMERMIHLITSQKPQ